MSDQHNFSYGNIGMIGIGGIGMSALAQLLHARGATIFGINDESSRETLAPLEELGITITFYHEGRDTVPPIPAVDAWVYSTAWEARAPTLMKHLRNSGMPLFSYAEALGLVSRDFYTVAVSGTHGKTTTTGLLSYALIYADMNPTVIVGSRIRWEDGHISNFRAGGELLVIEACEYKRHFLNFHPELALITNIELDHPDYYHSLEDVRKAFATFAGQSKQVFTSEDSEASHLGRELPQLHLFGMHNRSNASLALTGALALGADKERSKEGIAAFPGAWRRLEFLGTTAAGAMVYDDYAHHPTEIRATLQALRERVGMQRIVVIFESHTYTRTKALMHDFAKSFNDADEVIIAPIYPARESPIEGVTAESLAESIAAQHSSVRAARTLSEAAAMGKAATKKGEVLLFMGAGDIYKEAETAVV